MNKLFKKCIKIQSFRFECKSLFSVYRLFSKRPPFRYIIGLKCLVSEKKVLYLINNPVLRAHYIICITRTPPAQNQIYLLLFSGNGKTVERVINPSAEDRAGIKNRVPMACRKILWSVVMSYRTNSTVSTGRFYVRRISPNVEPIQRGYSKRRSFVTPSCFPRHGVKKTRK